MNANSPLSESENKPCLSESVRAALTGPLHGGFIYPIDRAACKIDPAFDCMNLWLKFLKLHRQGLVSDLGFRIPDPAEEEEGYYLAKSRFFPQLNRCDPLYPVIANLENQWRIRWLCNLMFYADKFILTEFQPSMDFSGGELAGYLENHCPGLIPQKTYRCRGEAGTRIENTLMDLMIFSPAVTEFNRVMTANWGHRPNPYGKGNKKTPIFTFSRLED